MEDSVILNVSKNEIEDLIYAFKTIHHRLTEGDIVDISIDTNKGEITTNVKPRGNYNFTIEF